MRLLAGLAFALDLGFWHYGIANTSVGKATVLTNLTPVVVTAVAWIFLKQRPARLFLLAVALAVAGAWMMAVAKGLGSVGPNPLLGDALSLATAIWYALYFLAVSAARRREAATRIMFWSSLAGAPLLLVAALAAGRADRSRDRRRLGGLRRSGRGARGRAGLDRLGARPPAARHRLGDRPRPAGGGRDAGLAAVQRAVQRLADRGRGDGPGRRGAGAVGCARIAKKVRAPGYGPP